jgi:hypothetical protein
LLSTESTLVHTMECIVLRIVLSSSIILKTGEAKNKIVYHDNGGHVYATCRSQQITAVIIIPPILRS